MKEEKHNYIERIYTDEELGKALGIKGTVVMVIADTYNEQVKIRYVEGQE